MHLPRGRILPLLVLAALAVLRPAAAEDAPIRLSGDRVTVIDGDTFQADDTVIQLSGIDAPELGQVCDNAGSAWPCGMATAYELRKVLTYEKREVLCYPQGRADGAVLASCTFGDNDVALNLLANGNAVALKDAAGPYLNAQHKAEGATLGIWRGAFVMPADWRKGQRLKDEPAYEEAHAMRSDSPWKWGGTPLMPAHDPLHSACLVKGAIAKDGKRIYLSPLDKGYADREIDTAKGERFFCSDDDARHAGWRRPGEKAS
jgi:endonuclease YncB( thermonuclease family)